MNLAEEQHGGSDEAYVRFDRVQKSYDGEILVVKDLNLDIAKGEFVTMLGTIRFWQNNLPYDVGWV